MNYLFKKFDVKIKTAAPYNHQSLQAQHSIKSLSLILTTHLTDLSQMWPKYLPIVTWQIILLILHILLISPYEFIFGRKWKLLLDLETNSDIKVSGTFKDYHTPVYEFYHFLP